MRPNLFFVLVLYFISWNTTAFYIKDGEGDEKILVIEDGDNLWNVSQQLFKNGFTAYDLWTYRIDQREGNPNFVRPGDEFRLVPKPKTSEKQNETFDVWQDELIKHNKKIDSILANSVKLKEAAEYFKLNDQKSVVDKLLKWLPQSIAAVCISFIVAILGIALPLLINSVSKFQEKYNSVSITELFEKEHIRKSFFTALTVSLILVLLLLVGLGFLHNDYYFNEYRFVDPVLILTTAFLIVAFFRYINLIVTYHLPHKILNHFIKRHDTKTSSQQSQYFMAINDILVFSIKNQDADLTRDISDFLYRQFEKVRESNESGPIVYPEEYYYLLIDAIVELGPNQNQKLVFFEQLVSGSEFLLGVKKYYPVSERTYFWMWRILKLAFEYGKDDMIMAHWITANDYIGYRLQTYSRSDRQEGMNRENDFQDEKKQFFTFHIALGGLLMYGRKYTLIDRFFRYTTGEPPNYNLLPQVMSDIFYWYNAFSDVFNFRDILKYDFPKSEGINRENLTRRWCKKYVALLYIRQFTLIQYYDTILNPKAPPKKPETQIERKEWLTHLPHLKKLVQDLMMDEVLMTSLGYDINAINAQNEVTPDGLLAQLIREIEEDYKEAEYGQELSQQRISDFTTTSNEILGKTMDEYLPISRADKFLEGTYDRRFIHGSGRPMKRAAFADDQDVSYLNYGSVLAEGISNEFRYGISEIFLINRTIKYTIKVDKLSKAIKRLELDPDQHIIISFGLNMEYLKEDIVSLNNSEINGIQIINYDSYNAAVMNRSLFVLEKSNLPHIRNNDLDKNTIKKYELKPINKDRKIYASIVDLNKRADLITEIEKKGGTKEDLKKSVLLSIMFTTEIQWSKKTKCVMIDLYFEYENRGEVNDVTNIQPF